MQKIYSDILESYLIPVEEGLFSTNKSLFNRKKTQQAVVATSSPVNNPVKKVEDPYLKNVRMVINKLQEEYPEVVEKEMKNRYLECKKLVTIIEKLAKKYKNIPGFKVSSENLQKYLEISKKTKYGYDPYAPYDSNDPNADIFTDCDFLQEILPFNKPVFYTFIEQEKVGHQDWFYKTQWTVTYMTSNIHDWGESVYGDKYISGEINIRDPKYNQEYFDILDNISNDLESMCRGLKYYMTTNYSGDWDNGIQDIVFKPSDEFLKLARNNGYNA